MEELPPSLFFHHVISHQEGAYLTIYINILVQDNKATLGIDSSFITKSKWTTEIEYFGRVEKVLE